MEEGIHLQDTAGFKECLFLARKNPYILRLAFSAGIGGLLFGYDTGVISGALLYIREDFSPVDKKTVLQETIVSMAIAGAIVGAAIGGWLNDRFGRKTAMLWADFLFLIGAIVMAAAPNPVVLILGRIFVGIGVGMASFTSPLYISESSPTKIRGALVSTNSFLVTGGAFLSYLINIAFTKAPGTWRWMLGIAGLPALLQIILMFLLPESPRWLYRKGREEEATAIMAMIYPPETLKEEVQDLKESIENEEAEKKISGEINLLNLLKIKAIRRGLIAGVGVQVLQQFVGINTVMYYSPTIVQFAGIASNQTALLLSLVTAGLNAVGSVVSIYFVDRTGRKKLMVFSLVGIVISLSFLGAVFQVSTVKAPKIGLAETSHFTGLTCPAYESAPSSNWNCMKCLKANPSCGFCAAKDEMLPGACLISNKTVGSACHGEDRVWYTKGCPSKTGWLAVVALAIYIISYSPGMGTVPWIINSEIYPLRFRGISGGIAATSNWISNLIVSQSFLSMTETIGTSWTFIIFAGFSLIGFFFVLIFVPETKGLPIEEIEKTLEKRTLRLRFREQSTDDQPRNQV